MKTFICKLLRVDPDSREGIVSATSGLSILVNLLVALAKVILGALTSSIAIVSEGINNASDALTSVLTLLGTRLAGRHPDKKHPFGYGRIEYLTSLVIAVLILVTGVEMVISSVKLIIHPEEMSVDYISVIIVAVTAVIKFFLGLYTIKQGKKAESSALEAVGLDCRNDAFASAITIAATLIYLLFHVSLDAYAGLIISALILKAGFEVLKDTVAELLGRPGEKELAEDIYRQVRATPGILNAADMMLHNYGPDRWSGSVNVEMDHELSIGDAYRVLHELQLKIMHEQKVTMVFGIYAVDNDHEESRRLRHDIGEFILKHEHIESLHAVYLEPETDRIYCDFVVDYDLRDWDSLKAEFLAYMDKLYPGRPVELTVETAFV